jgi:hypothetical protein
VDAGVGSDIDGDCNDTAVEDIDADESRCQCRTYLPLVLRHFPRET